MMSMMMPKRSRGPPPWMTEECQVCEGSMRQLMTGDQSIYYGTKLDIQSFYVYVNIFIYIIVMHAYGCGANDIYSMKVYI